MFGAGSDTVESSSKLIIRLYLLITHVDSSRNQFHGHGLRFVPGRTKMGARGDRQDCRAATRYTYTDPLLYLLNVMVYSPDIQGPRSLTASRSIRLGVYEMVSHHLYNA